MKSTTCPGCVLVLLVMLTLVSLASAESKAKSKTLIDFTTQDSEWVGVEAKPIRKYEFAYDTWQNKLVFIDGKGVLVPALPGKGVMGANEGLKFGPALAAEIVIVIGNRNESESLTFSMVDSDGTDVSWYLPLKDKPRGATQTYAIQLDKPDKEDKPGKKPGFDKNKTKSWQLKGNWQEPKVEVLFVRIAAAAP